MTKCRVLMCWDVSLCQFIRDIKMQFENNKIIPGENDKINLNFDIQTLLQSTTILNT